MVTFGPGAGKATAAAEHWKSSHNRKRETELLYNEDASGKPADGREPGSELFSHSGEVKMMIQIHPEYVVDRDKKTKAVLIPVQEWEKILEQLEELEELRTASAEDQEDLTAFETRASEPTMSYEELLSDLKAPGKL